eukprot:scaffold114214_cov30-Tisochrysis_lutea.AAC.7
MRSAQWSRASARQSIASSRVMSLEALLVASCTARRERSADSVRASASFSSSSVRASGPSTHFFISRTANTKGVGSCSTTATVPEVGCRCPTEAAAPPEGTSVAALHSSALRKALRFSPISFASSLASLPPSASSWATP